MDPVKLRHLLIRIVDHKDERAFSAFFDHFHTRFMNLAMLYITQYDQAEEVVSEVFLKLLKKRQELLNIERFEGYIFAMVKYEALNYLKVKNRERGNLLIDNIQDYLTSDLIQPEAKLINDELRNVLDGAIQKLPPKRRLTFKMVKDEGMSYREVAGILDISERTVEVHLKLAIQDLRDVLQAFYDQQ